MSDEIKQIAALVGYQQEHEKQVDALIKKLDKLADNLPAKVTAGVDGAIKKTLQDVKLELLELGEKKQQPILSELMQSLDALQERLITINQVMHWKFVLSLSITLLLGLAICCGVFTYFLDHSYARISAMREMEKEWEIKAPFANIGTCGGKPCVQITGNEYTDKEGNRYYQIKKNK
ncbi:MAG: hypothetical protein ACRC9R_01755 [Enterovibrio sp.]